MMRFHYIKLTFSAFLISSSLSSFAADYSSGSSGASGSLYVGGNYGLAKFTNPATEKYQLSSSGKSFGALAGYKIQIIGIEGFYQKFNTESEIRHSGSTYKLSNDTTAIGAALRVNLSFLYGRVGYASFTTNQSVAAEDGTPTTNATLKTIYNVSDNDIKSKGAVLGAGLQMRFGRKFRIMAEYTRYNVNGVDGVFQVLGAGVIIQLPDMRLPSIKSE